MSTDNNKPTQPALPSEPQAQSEAVSDAQISEGASTVKPANINAASSNEGNKQNAADAKIQSHRKQHQQKLGKVFGGAAIIVALVVLAFSGNYFLTQKSPEIRDDEPLVAEPLALSAADIEQFREQFKQALTQYEVNAQPSIDQILLSDWEVDGATELSLLKEQALKAFALGAFKQAQQILNTLNEKSARLIAQWQIQIQQHVDKAQQAFDNGQIPQAQLQVNKALALSPTNRDALQLQNRIFADGEVSKLIDDLKVAVNENNWLKQVEVISDIIELDPERTELEKHLAQAEAQYDQQQLAKYLQQADAALQANQIDQAQALVNKAKQIKPDSKGAQALTQAINQAKAQKGLAGIQSVLAQASEQDNWEAVMSLVSSSLPAHPNDPVLKRYQAQAQQVLSAKKSLALFISRPERLADEKIRSAASDAVQSAFSAFMLSPSLQRQIEQVTSSIDAYSSPVDVKINSDGKTYVIVVGVGHVGAHIEKVISLKPANYVLEGKRDGFRTKRLEFSVNAKSPIELTLICDEAI